jgi:ABC-type uncharacterized transport system involved in gliding motility auxiliary subunit
MSKSSKISYIIFVLALVSLMIMRFIIGGWLQWFWGFFVVMAITLLIGIYSDRRFFKDFFLMRTTKHGANMGVLILMSLALVVASNYLGYRSNKTFDVTEEKLNSLSLQSQQVLKALKGEVTFTVFYVPDQNRDFRQQLRNDLSMYLDQSSLIKMRFVNSYENPGLATDYLRDKNTKTALFAEHQGRRIMVDSPYNETNVTSAIVRATRDTQKTIYFVTGHGEPNIDGQNGLQVLRAGLEGMSFKLANLNLAMGDNMPTGDAVIAIIGPKNAFLDVELERLRAFVKQGGRLLIAIDPGQNHNLANLTRSFGIEFKNNYMLSVQLQQNGLIVAATNFDKNNEITRGFPTPGFAAAFFEASELARAKEAPTAWTYHELVQTEDQAVAFSDPRAKTIESDSRRRLVGAQVDIPIETNTVTTDKDGKITEAPSDKPQSRTAVAIFGDSDFFTDRVINQLGNRDLAFNIFASLGREPELSGIRPPKAKGTTLLLTQNYFFGVVGGGVAVPVLLLGLAGYFWYRRRNL